MTETIDVDDEDDEDDEGGGGGERLYDFEKFLFLKNKPCLKKIPFLANKNTFNFDIEKKISNKAQY